MLIHKNINRISKIKERNAHFKSPWAIFTFQEASPKTASKASSCKNVGFYYTPSPLIKSVVDLYLTTGKEIKSIFKA